MKPQPSVAHPAAASGCAAEVHIGPASPRSTCLAASVPASYALRATDAIARALKLGPAPLDLAVNSRREEHQRPAVLLRRGPRGATSVEPLREHVRLAVMMLDGMEIAERTHVVALGITTEGVKTPLGLWKGSTGNATLDCTLRRTRSTGAWTSSRDCCS
jgi:hypothetical protein